MIPQGMAREVVHLVIESCPDDDKPGMVFVGLLNEKPSPNGKQIALDLDCSLACRAAETEAGGLLIIEFARRLRLAVEAIARELTDGAMISGFEREGPDPGERAKA